MLILRVHPTEASAWIEAPGDLKLAHPEVIRCYYRDIDVTLIRENLKLTECSRPSKGFRSCSRVARIREERKRISE
jgi:hypothetical protein